ncbi:MAG: DUF499 domain-containing protein, partial [Dehalococcoidia bacterium]|nr:DUF499 domain-containing protein [Dehalococcoidia bacterium]
IPRPEVLHGTLDDAIFAAELRYLVAGSAPAVYQDPAIFFRNTYPTKHLKTIVEDVFRRLKNPDEPGALIRLSTGFGGGKTHALMTLWHLAKNIDRHDLGTELLPAENRPPAVAVAAIDGQVGGSQEFARHGTLVTRTIWGELAYQLGGQSAYARIAAVDRLDETPSESQLEDIFPPGPVLILLDELVSYMAGLPEQGQNSLIAFVQKLAGFCVKRKQTVLVVSDPAGQAAYRKQSERLDRALKETIEKETIKQKIEEEERAVRLDQVISRVFTDRDPIGAEGARVIIRRLFEQIDESERDRIARAYRELYERVHRDHPGRLDPAVATSEYAERIRTCFPFHPRLFVTAEERLSALPDFQRSRGTLRLFARLVRRAWQGEELDLITAGDLDWSDPDLREELLGRLNRTGFDAAIKADIEGHAAELDSAASRRIHRRVLSALLLDSLPLDSKSGLSRNDVTLTTLRLDDAGPEPIDAAERLESVCWHLYPREHTEGWQFKVEPNIIREIEERTASVSAEDARPRVLAVAQQYFNGSFFQLVGWPSGPSSVAETARLTLALCESEQLAKEVVRFSDTSRPTVPMPRRFTNAIVAIAPAGSALSDAIERARRLIAAERVREERQRRDDYHLVKRQLEHYLTEAERTLRREACRAFTSVVVGEHVYQLPAQYQFPTDEPLRPLTGGQSKLREFLEHHELLYREDDALDPFVLLSNVLPGATPQPDQPGVWTAKAVHERLLASPGLRLILNDKFVLTTLRKAVMEGKLVLRISDGTAYHGTSRVAGPPEARRRMTGAPPLSFPLTDETLVALPDSDAARAWLAESAPVPGETGAAAGGFVPPPPPPAVGAANNWEEAARLADEGRPLRTLKLVASRPEVAQAMLGVLPVLGATESLLSVTVSGQLRGGGQAAFRVEGVKPSHPTKPLEVARALFSASEDASYEATLALRFDDGSIVTSETVRTAAAAAGDATVR